MRAVAEWVGSLELIGAAIFATAALVEWSLRRRSAAGRRQVWALAIAVALVLPVTRLALAAPEAQAPGRLAAVGLSIWAAGALLLLARLVHGLAEARRRRDAGAPLVEGPWHATAQSLAREGLRVELRACAAIDTPQVVGALRPVILVPPSLLDAPEAERRALLAHELAHVARADGLVLLAGAVVRALYWPNPLAWWALRRLRSHAEAAADDAALHTGIPSSSYAAQLVAVARARLDRAGKVAAGGLPARVRGVLDAGRLRSVEAAPRWAVPRLAAAAVVLATLVTACEARSADPAGPRDAAAHEE